MASVVEVGGHRFRGTDGVPGLSILCKGKNVQTANRLFYYQLEMLGQLENTRRVLLAADMGVGKTIISFCLIAKILHGLLEDDGVPPDERKCLFLCELSLLDNAVREARNHFLPNTFRVLVMTHRERDAANAEPAAFLRKIEKPFSEGGYNVIIAPYTWLAGLNTAACKVVKQQTSVVERRRATITDWVKMANGGGVPSSPPAAPPAPEQRKKKKQRTKAKAKQLRDGSTINLRMLAGKTQEERRRCIRPNTCARVFCQRFSVVICDEAQKIKTPAAQRTIAVNNLLANRIVFLSGTPQENRAQELRNLFLSLGLDDLDNHSLEICGCDQGTKYLLESEDRWLQASRAKYTERETPVLDHLLAAHMIRVTREQVLRRRVCEQPGSRHQRALEAGLSVPTLLLEDVVRNNLVVDFATDHEVMVGNHLLTMTQQEVSNWRSGSSSASSKATAKLAPLQALIVLQKFTFSTRMFDPRVMLAGDRLGAYYKLVQEEWSVDGTACTLRYLTGKNVLRKYVVDPVILPQALIMESRKTTSTKVRLLGDAVAKSIEAGEKTVVFSHWKAEMVIARDYLDGRFGAGTCVLVYGAVDTPMRPEVISRLRRDPKCHVLVAMISVFSTGINLSFVRLVLFPTADYNPDNRSQAEARADRFGQLGQVVSTRLLIDNTIDMAIAAMNDRKSFESTIMLDGFQALTSESTGSKAGESRCTEEIQRIILAAKPIQVSDPSFHARYLQVTTSEVLPPTPPPVLPPPLPIRRVEVEREFDPLWDDDEPGVGDKRSGSTAGLWLPSLKKGEKGTPETSLLQMLLAEAKEMNQ